MERCANCDEDKPSDTFPKRRNNPYPGVCQPCRARLSRQAYRQRAEARGACVKCSRPSEEGSRYCAECRRRNRERAASDPEQRRAWFRDWTQRNREHRLAYQRRQNLRRKYGITVAEYDRLLARQGAVCAICGGTEPRRKGLLYVDHDHATGAIRGLLCHTCNAGIGAFKESADLVRKALAYMTG